MSQKNIKAYYWSSRNTLQLSQFLVSMEPEISNQLLDISKKLLEELQKCYHSDEGTTDTDEIKEEIQRYVDEIRAEASDK